MSGCVGSSNGAPNSVGATCCCGCGRGRWRFARFVEGSFPASSLPALTWAAATYGRDLATGERLSLALRDLLFEQGVDIADAEVLERLAADHDVAVDLTETRRVLDEHAEGVARGVIGSPHFFTPSGGFFCPSLDVHRDAGGHLRITADTLGFDRFVAACFDQAV